MVNAIPVRPRSGPRFEPRSLLRNPREFGKKMNPEFVKETTANISQISGAMVQHAFARAIQVSLFERGMDMVSLSEATGLNYQRLTRMLRGTVLMRLEDIGMIVRVLPEAFAPAVMNVGRLSAQNATQPS